MHWKDLEGSGGEGGGRGDQDGEHMQTHGCYISMYDKIHYNIKNKKIKKKKIDKALIAPGPSLETLLRTFACQEHICCK